MTHPIFGALALLFLTACDPAVIHTAIIKPEENLIRPSKERLSEAEYLSFDRRVSLKVHKQDIMGGHLIRAKITNRRDSPIFLNLDNAQQYVGGAHSGTKARATEPPCKKAWLGLKCEPAIVQINPGQFRWVTWTFDRGQMGEFIVPIASLDHPRDDLQIQFQVCGWDGKLCPNDGAKE